MDEQKLRLLLALAAMPDEAFGWVVEAVAHNIFPDGLGGFRAESRTAIEQAIAAARAFSESSR